MIVVKIGGAQGIDIERISKNVASLVHQDQRLVIVHGGSAEVNEISEKLGHPPRFVTSVSGYSSRYTNRETLKIFAMVTNGQINTMLVESLQKNGVNAFGLSGLDGGLITARRKETIRIVDNGRIRILRDDYTGKIESINKCILDSLIKAGFTPVISPLALSHQGEALNVDADRAAAMVAGALKAKTLVILSNVPGLMRSYPDESTLISHINYREIDQALSLAEGRMKKKVLGAGEALAQGVRQVILADGRVHNPLSNALNRNGTIISLQGSEEK